MKKIPSLFQRNYDTDRLVRDEVVPGSEWVLHGEGVATRKWDGTCCMIRGGKLFKRYTLRVGKAAPFDFEPATEVDQKTGKQEGWVQVGNGSEDRTYQEAFDKSLPDGTYELCGPKVQSNPESYDKHVLIPHGKDELVDVPRDFDGIKSYLSSGEIEGIVWWHPDGRKVKIKSKDFGIVRKH